MEKKNIAETKIKKFLKEVLYKYFPKDSWTKHTLDWDDGDWGIRFEHVRYDWKNKLRFKVSLSVEDTETHRKLILNEMKGGNKKCKQKLKQTKKNHSKP